MGGLPTGQIRARDPSSSSSLIVRRANRKSAQRRHSHAPPRESQPPASGNSALSTEPVGIAPLATSLPVNAKSPSPICEIRSEEHTSERQQLLRHSSSVFSLEKHTYQLYTRRMKA